LSPGPTKSFRLRTCGSGHECGVGPSKPQRDIKGLVNDLLSNPAVQAGVVPFIVGLFIALPLARTRFLALAVAAGLLAVLALTIGFSIDPFTSVKKLVAVVLGATVVSLALEAANIAPRRAIIAALSALAALAALWVTWRVLVQRESPSLWVGAVGALAFAAGTTASATAASAHSSLRGAVIGAMLGWGSGILALLGASALLAQLGLAVGSASAAVALVQMVRGREAPLGWTVVLPAAVAASTIGVLAATTGELRWYCLLPLPFAPLLAWLVPQGLARRTWQQAFLVGFAALVPIAVAIALAWWSPGASSSAG
jgi:hypothetical protein